MDSRASFGDINEEIKVIDTSQTGNCSTQSMGRFNSKSSQRKTQAQREEKEVLGFS
jgi:hypothetical protein